MVKMNHCGISTQSNIPSESLRVFVSSICRNGSKLFVFISALNSQFICIMFRCCKSTHNSTTPCSKRKNCISTNVTLGELCSLPVQNSPLSEPNFSKTNVNSDFTAMSAFWLHSFPLNRKYKEVNPSVWSIEHCSSTRKLHLSWSNERCSFAALSYSFDYISTT